MLAEEGVRVLVQCASIKSSKGEIVLGEVRWNPVEDDSDASLVQGIHEEAEVVGIAKPCGRSVVGGDLVAPRATKRVLSKRHELHVRKAQAADILGELVRGIAIVEPLAP